MSDTNTESVSEWLHRWRNLEECLVHEVQISPDLYQVVITFNYVWDASGAVRERVLEEPVLLTLRLIGLEQIRFVGALTEGMKQHPDRINWGLTEVAGVRVHQHDGLVELTVEWESDRRLDVQCMTIETADPGT